MPIFSAYTANSAALVPKILDIHLPLGGLIADVTYGLGVFWRKVEAHEQQNHFFRPLYQIITSDKAQPAQVRADFTCLPYRSQQFDCVVLDPPWGNLSTAPRNQGINERYQIPPMSVTECKALYTQGMNEGVRILKPKGILIIKCQDQVSSGKKHWFSIDIFRHGESLGLQVVDRMIQVSGGAASDCEGTEKNVSSSDFFDTDETTEHQEHFKSRESIYWVMKKKREKREKRENKDNREKSKTDETTHQKESTT